MPILNREVACFPEDLLGELNVDHGERRWWVLHTRSRQEKSVARVLLEGKTPFYLPLVARTALYRGRQRTSYTPLFTSYVFMFGNEQDRLRALGTNRLANMIPVVDPTQLVGDLRQIWQLIASDAPLTVESRLEPGQRVRVRSGAMAGVEGIVVARKRKCRLIVAVQLLQQGVSVEIDDFLLEPLDSP